MEDIPCDWETFKKIVSRAKVKEKYVLKEITIRLLKKYRIKYLVDWHKDGEAVDIYLPHHDITINFFTTGFKKSVNIFCDSIPHFIAEMEGLIKKERCPICGEFVDLELHLEHDDDCRKKYLDYIDNLRKNFIIKKEEFQIHPNAVKSLLCLA